MISNSIVKYAVRLAAAESQSCTFLTFQAKAAYVERSPDAAHILKDSVGRVPLKILPGENSSWMKVNLDDAGSEVYKLSKVKGEERNLFRIVVELLFKDTNTRKVFYSDTFQVKSKPKSAGKV